MPRGGLAALVAAAALTRPGHAARSHHQFEDVFTSTSGPSLNVFASTFSAGNQVYSQGTKGRFQDMLKSIARGHEDSDLVIMGFQEFSDADYGFADLVKKTLWGEETKNKQHKLRQELLDLASAPAEVLDQKDKVVAYLAEKDSSLEKALADIDVPDIQQKLHPMEDWASQQQQKIAAVWPRYPNLQYTESGSAKVKKFSSSFDHVARIEKQVSARVEIARQLVAARPAGSGGSPERWMKLEQALATLQRDLARAPQLSSWSGNLAEEASGLLQEPGLELDAGHVDVKFQPVRFKTTGMSGMRCSMQNKYDTVLYAFANPWSEWQIVEEPYSSSRCTVGDDDASRGCSIDNNEDNGCGDAVNLLRLRATRGSTTMRFCALNTRMSTNKQASVRMSALAAALDEAKGAQCDSLVFVGDFNTRLHCNANGQGQGGRERPENEIAGDSPSSLEHVLDLFSNGKLDYALGGSPHAHLDELSQMLANKTVNCFEESVSGENWLFRGQKTWRAAPMPNPVYRPGLFEAPPHFAPTSKMAPWRKAMGSKKAYRCSRDGGSCYYNPSGNGEDNPAWTDRVLLQAEPGRAKVEVLEYSRRAISEDFGSDHAAVVGKVAVRPMT